MNWITDVANKSKDIPLASFLKDRLNLKRLSHSDTERDELLVKIDILTAKNSELMQVANLDSAQQEHQISGEEIEILQQIAKENVASAREIADVFGINIARAEYRLTELVEHGYLVDFTTLNYHAYLLDRRGRDYLVENNLHRFKV